MITKEQKNKILDMIETVVDAKSEYDEELHTEYYSREDYYKALETLNKASDDLENYLESITE